MTEGYDVLIIAMSYSEDGEQRVRGFPTIDLAREFARRWVRDSLEELRETDQSKDDLRKA